MTTEQVKEVVLRQFELINSGDSEGAAALWASESYNHGKRVDKAGLTRLYQSLHSLREKHTIHEVIAEGDRVAVRTTCTGVHAGEPSIPVNGGIFTGIQPTGRAYTVQHTHFFKVHDGLITEHWANRDDLGAARQIGRELSPPKGT
ncbi:MAG: ester cyclase [Thaumarchaeota archaeon]|nr:ester cyclase [Nitrososphaerota archaeon]